MTNILADVQSGTAAERGQVVPVGEQHAQWDRNLADVVQAASYHLLGKDEGEDLRRLAAVDALQGPVHVDARQEQSPATLGGGFALDQAHRLARRFEFLQDDADFAGSRGHDGAQSGPQRPHAEVPVAAFARWGKQVDQTGEKLERGEQNLGAAFDRWAAQAIGRKIICEALGLPF
jgi:hypothetical protein